MRYLKLIYLFISVIGSSFSAQAGEQVLLKLQQDVIARKCMGTSYEVSNSTHPACRGDIGKLPKGTQVEVLDIIKLLKGAKIFGTPSGVTTILKDNSYIHIKRGTEDAFIPLYNDKGKANFTKSQFDAAWKAKETAHTVALPPPVLPKVAEDCCRINKNLADKLSVIIDKARLKTGPSNKQLKSMGELERYFETYQRYEDGFKEQICKDPSVNHKIYVQSFSKYIKTASKSFTKIPPQYLACLLFTENHWRDNANTKSGARGIAQFLTKTARTTSRIINSNARTTSEKFNERQRFLANPENKNLFDKLKARPLTPPYREAKPINGCGQFAYFYARYKDSKSNTWSYRQKKTNRLISGKPSPQLTAWIEQKAITCQPYDNYKYAQTLVIQYKAAEPWKSYIKDLNKLDHYVDNYRPDRSDLDEYTKYKNTTHRTPNYAPTQPPTKFTPYRGTYKEIISPPLAIGAAATYLNYIITRMELTTGRTIDASNPKDLNALLAVAGAYNAGPSHLIRAYQKYGNNPEKWMREIGRQSDEARRYMASIKNCMTKGITKGPVRRSGPENPTCSNVKITED